ncbi:glycosyltransferase [Ideonella sp. DXS22W]|uniref:Glycosyltransferase n=1 Tax=Pseudaquabacterium inlustre TaxID=2984192 RepID=A0ABU9CHQ2_9BURK
MTRTIHLFSHGAEHTTAQYFYRAAKLDAAPVIYWDKAPDLSVIRAEDLFVFIDPAPDWPLHLEALPCTTVAYFIDVHQERESRLQQARFFDVVFIAQKDYLHYFQAEGHRQVHWLPLGCDPEVHVQPAPERIFDVGFVGKLGLRGTERHTLLTTVLPRYRSNDYLAYHAPRDMAAAYGRSKIVFNASINQDVNMRVFEGLAAGALLVTDRIPNGLDELFTEGVHYVGYSTVEEAIAQIDRHLAHPDELQRIALAGQQCVLSMHTYRQRWLTILDVSASATRTAPARTMGRRDLATLYAQIFVGLRMPRRILDVLSTYGVAAKPVRLGLLSAARWLNAKVPLTPNAIRARLRSRR